MTRLRRSFHFPFFLLVIVLIVFCGSRTISIRYNVDPEKIIYEDDPLDVPVPRSEKDNFQSIGDDGKLTKGRPFSADALRQVEFLNEVEGSAVTTFKNNEVVFVMYASSNHFRESRESIRKLRQVTNNTLIYYDLGLDSAQVKDLEEACNVKVVKFNFTAYPRHTKSLLTYAFKPIIMGQMYRHSEQLKKFYDRVRKGEIEPFSAEHPTGHSIGAATHNQMFEYLPLPKEGRESGMRQALTMFTVRSQMAKEIVKWNMICALTESCISPRGTTPFCGAVRFGSSVSCHRFDQSSVNVILCSINLRRKLPCLPMTAKVGAYSSFVGVERDVGYDGPLVTC